MLITFLDKLSFIVVSRDQSTNSQPTNAPQVSNSIQQSQLLEMFPNIAADVVEAALLEEDPVEFLLTYGWLIYLYQHRSFLF